MAKEPQEKPVEDEKPDWERFERTVDKMLHTPPKPHESSRKKGGPKKNRPAKKG